MASTHATDSMEIKFKVPKWVIYALVAILVLTAAIVAASTIKERITDPAIDKTAETAKNVGEKIAAIPQEQREAEIIGAVKKAFKEKYGTSPDSVGSTFRIGTEEEAREIARTTGGDHHFDKAPDDAVYVIESQNGNPKARGWYVFQTSDGWKAE